MAEYARPAAATKPRAAPAGGRTDEFRRNYEAVCKTHRPEAFAVRVLERVGYCDARGNRYRTADGVPCLNPDAVERPGDVNLAELAEAVVGRDWPQQLGLDRGRGTGLPATWMRPLSEEAAAPIGPSPFANVAAWLATVGGLLQAQFLAGYEAAEYDLLGLFPTVKPTFWIGGERSISILGPYTPAPEVGPGEEHPDLPLSALWVEPGPMKKYGGKILVTKELGAIDLSGGQILQRAKEGGETIAFRENELILDIVTGQRNNFRLGMLQDAAATGYNTYNPTITRPDGVAVAVNNDLVNPLATTDALYASDQAVGRLRHPLTGLPINVQMDTILCNTGQATLLNAFLTATQLALQLQSTAAGVQPAPGQFPNMVSTGANPYAGRFTVRPSRWLQERHEAPTVSADPNRSPGLGLSEATAKRWYRLDPAKFAVRRCMWEPDRIDLSPNDYVMAVQGILAGQVFNIAVMYQVLNPFAIQRNKVV